MEQGLRKFILTTFQDENPFDSKYEAANQPLDLQKFARKNSIVKAKKDNKIPSWSDKMQQLFNIK